MGINVLANAAGSLSILCSLPTRVPVIAADHAS
jgi:hypothetical protein